MRVLDPLLPSAHLCCLPGSNDYLCMLRLPVFFSFGFLCYLGVCFFLPCFWIVSAVMLILFFFVALQGVNFCFSCLFKILGGFFPHALAIVFFSGTPLICNFFSLFIQCCFILVNGYSHAISLWSVVWLFNIVVKPARLLG